MKISFMTFKSLGQRLLPGAFGLEGSRARVNSRLKLEQVERSVLKGGAVRRRYLLIYKFSRHSLSCSRKKLSLLYYFHHAKERRKLKVGL